MLGKVSQSRSSGAGYKEAVRYFKINPQNHSGKRLYKLIGPGAKLLVTNACRELVNHANKHGTPDPVWLHENLNTILEKFPIDLILVCGKVAQKTYADIGYNFTPPVINIMHPAARTWSKKLIEETQQEISRILRNDS